MKTIKLTSFALFSALNIMPLSDDYLVKKVKESSCSSSLTELSNRHGGLVDSIVKKYAAASANAGCSGLSLTDFREDKLLIVYNAALQFNPSKKSKFSTWLGNATRFHCLNTYKKSRKYVDGTSYLSEYAETANGDEIALNKLMGDAAYVMNLLHGFKDSRVSTIFRMRYFSNDLKNTSFAHIAKHLKMSTQGIIDIHNEAVEFIKLKSAATEKMDEI